MARDRRPGESSPAALRALADEDLMYLVRQGEARAFEVVYERHSGPAFSLAYRMCGKRSTAEDVVQEAFLSLWRSGARYDRTRGSVRTWVLGIVHNRAIDALRRGHVHDRRRASDEGIEERFEARERTEVEVAQRDEAREIRDALQGLPAEQSRVIELAYFGGFTHTEIASMLDTPIGTIKGRMRLGLAKLHAHLLAAGQSLGPAEALS
ncbi:MAG TPA: sigma-70 family RNA polymerase sigma factor [Solirubrobacteraceae bacterium]|jgi:RNA polymerase sigma-70 factor (ECF subfamily)|nr:sigma-70 family RNA polymerase sigma factor [Solirubrobacteraceae bacterium]